MDPLQVDGVSAAIGGREARVRARFGVASIIVFAVGVLCYLGLVLIPAGSPPAGRFHTYLLAFLACLAVLVAASLAFVGAVRGERPKRYVIIGFALTMAWTVVLAGMLAAEILGASASSPERDEWLRKHWEEKRLAAYGRYMADEYPKRGESFRTLVTELWGYRFGGITANGDELRNYLGEPDLVQDAQDGRHHIYFYESGSPARRMAVHLRFKKDGRWELVAEDGDADSYVGSGEYSPPTEDRAPGRTNLSRLDSVFQEGRTHFSQPGNWASAGENARLGAKLCEDRIEHEYLMERYEQGGSADKATAVILLLVVRDMLLQIGERKSLPVSDAELQQYVSDCLALPNLPPPMREVLVSWKPGLPPPP